MNRATSLSVDTWSVENWGTPQPTFKFHVFNSGKNTAEIIDIVLRGCVDADLPAVPDYTNAPESSLALVVPGLRKESIFNVPVSPQQIAAIEQGASSLFIYGKITFKTVFFNTIWELGFAQRYVFMPDPQGNRIGIFEYPRKPGFNFLRRKT
jgi:hypothetical protein